MNRINNLIIITILLFASCTTRKQINNASTLLESGYSYSSSELPITQSLFNDKNSTITEENIQKILEGRYELPQKIRVAIVRLESSQNYRRHFWSDEQYVKSQQLYLDLFSDKIQKSRRAIKVSAMPDMLVSSNPTFTSIRESAVRTQSDLVVIYSITNDVYSRYKLFSKTDIKAFATIQLIVLDTRTGLIPFSTIATKDVQSKKLDSELNEHEAINRIKSEAVLQTIEVIGNELASFLEAK